VRTVPAKTSLYKAPVEKKVGLGGEGKKMKGKEHRSERELKWPKRPGVGDEREGIWVSRRKGWVFAHRNGDTEQKERWLGEQKRIVAPKKVGTGV